MIEKISYTVKLHSNMIWWWPPLKCVGMKLDFF